MYYKNETEAVPGRTNVWRKETIFKHLDQHAPTSGILHQGTLRTYSSVLCVLRDDGLSMKEANTGRLNVDRKALEMFIRVERLVRVGDLAAIIE